ncbi:FHA domain-containing protein [Seiridium cupressi]
MFTQPAPPSTTGLISPATDLAASPPPHSGSRGSRLRGFSYLRSYTQNHLLSRDSGVSAQSSASGAASGSSSQHPPLTRAATHSAISVSGRRRSRQADDLPSTSGDRIHRTTSTQNPQVSHGLLVETNSDSDSGRGKKHKTGTENAEANQARTTDDATMTRTRSATTGDLSLDMLPSIRFSAHYDPRSTRQSLSFTPISRTLPTGKESIKVGRYSEREQQQIVPANTPSAAPVGFKSKVVSRRHCEFWHEDGKWYIKDVKSSSGTFLNHIRLSPPGNESKPYVVNDGDIVQLGIDFRGGEEMIFRCVKMRIELNRGWQNKPNNFKAAADLDADIEEPDEDWQQLDDSGAEDINMESASPPEAPTNNEGETNRNPSVGAAEEPPSQVASTDGEAGDITMMLDHAPTIQDPLPRPEASSPVPIPRTSPTAVNGSNSSTNTRRTPSPPNRGTIIHEGPLTPRNDAGPWVFDGDAGRASQDISRPGAMVNLDAAATQIESSAR